MSSFGISAPNFESSGSDFNRGDHVLKPGAGIVMRPSWTKSDPTVIRPFPCIEGDSFQPARYSEHAYSKWFSECTMVSSFGNPQKSWIAYDPEDKSYEIRSNPAFMVYDLASQVSTGKVRGPQEWALAIKGGMGKSSAVSRPDRAVIIRCAIYEYKGIPKPVADGLAPFHQTVFMVLKKSAAQALFRELGMPSSTTSGPDINEKYASGDVVSVNDGAYFVFYEIGMTPRGYTPPTSSAAGYSNGKNKPIGYDCLISKTYRNMPASFSESEIAEVSKRVAQPIRSQLNFATDEEQVRYVVDSLRDCPAHAGLVVHALRDRYERFLPADFVSYGNEFLRQVGLMASSAANPGYAQPTLPTYPMPTQPYQAQAQPVYAPAPVPVYAPAPVPAPVPAAYRPAASVPDTKAAIDEVTNAPEMTENKDAIMAKLREYRGKIGLEPK